MQEVVVSTLSLVPRCWLIAIALAESSDWWLVLVQELSLASSFDFRVHVVAGSCAWRQGYHNVSSSRI